MSKLINFTTFAVILCLSISFPVDSMSRWFSASYADLQITMRRMGHCVGNLGPKRDNNGNESEYLIDRIKSFLDEANFTDEQLTNATALLDNLCKPEPNADYPISIHIDVNLYNGTNGKRARCRAIDEAMDAMYYVFKKAAMNASEPLDFSVIQFYPNATNTEATYNLTDLINTSWIKSETQVEQICKITDAVKDYIQAKTKINRRTNVPKAPETYYEMYWNFVDYFLEPLLGFERRFYLETNNRMEMVYNLVANQVSYLREGIGRSTRGFTSYFGARNTTVVSKTNSTNAQLNSTKVPTTATPMITEQPPITTTIAMNVTNNPTNTV